MAKASFEIRIKLQAPFLFPSVAAGRFGYDRVAMVDQQGRAIIPQDQVKGLLSHGLRETGHTDLATRLFGAKSGDATTPGDAPDGFEPRPGSIFFTDLVAAHDPPTAQGPYHRVQIDPESGAAKEGHLVTLEQLYPPGKDVTFTGRMTLFQPEDDPERLATVFRRALLTHLGIGANVSIGFGLIKQVIVDAEPSSIPTPIDQPLAALCNWTFRIDRPYLVNARRIADNAFKGERDVPGGALKGLIARNLSLRGLSLPQSTLSNIRIGFARPASGPPRPLPLSVVKAGSSYPDLAFASPPPGKIKLQIDWKDEEWSATGPHDGTPDFEERVHTAIKNGLAEQQMLYSAVAVLPAGEMVAQIDLSGLEAAEIDTLEELLSEPLVGLGRTDAEIETESVKPAPSGETSLEPGEVPIVLRTPALLAGPADDTDPLSAYREIWRDLLKHSELKDMFVAQDAMGGYIARRYPAFGAYQPWVLTRAASVFVFDLAEEDVGALERLLTNGVCRKTLQDGTEPNWRNCPFVPKNGYGEIDILEHGGR